LKNTYLTDTRADINPLLLQIEALQGVVVRQQQTLMQTAEPSVRREALRGSGEIIQMLLPLQRAVQELERRMQAREKERTQLRALQEVGAVINSSLDLNVVLQQVMDAITRLTKAERAMLLMFNEQQELRVTVARNVDQETLDKEATAEISRSIVRRVAETGDSIVTVNAQEDDRFSAQHSIISYKLRSILCVPLKSKEEIIGVIYADNRVASGIFGDTDRDLLTSFANQAAVAIENARLFQEVVRMKELMDNVFASIASGVITIDEMDSIALYNRAAEQILGLPSDSVLMQHFQQLLEKLELPIETLIEEVKANGNTQNTELDLRVQQRLLSLYLTLSPLHNLQQQKLGGVAVVLDDVSEKKRVESLRRYLPPALVDGIRDLDAAQRPQRRHITVMYADVRGFSTYSEHIDPEGLIEVINGYFTQAVNAISHYQGMTDKFMGDAVMVLFNSPLNPQVDHVERAVRTALLIRENVGRYHLSLPPEQRLYFGIGIHTGEAVVGNVGSEQRRDYSAIGDVVNLAKRLQEFATPGQIVISEQVYEQVQTLVTATPLPRQQLKGREAWEQLYDLQGIVTVNPLHGEPDAMPDSSLPVMDY
jgi:PAS domain S-box-containing protein